MPKKKRSKSIKFEINSRYKPVLYALGFLVILLLIAQLIKVLININSPTNPVYAQTQTQTKIWDGRTPVNIVVKGATVSILSYNPLGRKLTVLSIPDETYFKLPKGYGSWPVGSIFKLGEEEKPGRGATLLKESIASLLGMPMDRFILTTDSDLSSKELVNKLSRNPALNLLFLTKLQSDMSPIELWQLNQTLSGLRSDKIVYLDLGTSNLTESKLLPDSSRVLGVDAVSLDLFVRQKLYDQTILKEAYPVAIYNATGEPGLAVDGGRLITNLGGNVITTSNTEAQFDKSAILVMNGDQNELRQSYTFSRLAQIFAPSCAHQSCTVNDYRVNTSRAQIIIVLGRDYFLNNY